jgi:hypothetical protein
MFKLKTKAQKGFVCRITVDSDLLPIVIPLSRHDAKPVLAVVIIVFVNLVSPFSLRVTRLYQQLLLELLES